MLKQDKNLTPQIIHLCQQLVRTPSVNGLNPEIALAQVIMDFARQNGLQSELLALEEDRPNVLVRVGDSEEIGLLLVGHMDTVPTGNPESWKFPPFSGTISENRLYGRGAIDNKGGIAAALGALLLLKSQSFQDLEKSVVLACVPDEESGATGRLGINYLHKLNKLSGVGAIYTYPYLRESAMGHRGVLRVKINTYGKSFHTGLHAWQIADKSYNAVTGLSEILLELEKVKFEGKTSSSLFDRFETVLTPTLIEGGSGPSIVPDHASATLDIRLIPSVPGEKVKEKINEVIAGVQSRRPMLKVTTEGLVSLPTTIIPEDSKIISAIRSASRAVRGVEPDFVISGPANESYLLNEIGIPTCTLGPEGIGAHSIDENMDLSSLEDTIEIYSRVALELSGRRES